MNKPKYNLIVFLVISSIGLLLYYPILQNGFLSDDYDSLYRICIEHTIVVKEFFRPLIDISFKLNFFLSGLNSSGYYILNLAVHIANAFLVYKIANAFNFAGDNSRLFGCLSSFFFLIYPFHNEGVVWLNGRLSSISCFFALLCVYVWLGNAKLIVKAILGICFYFIGLLAYESILLLPFITFIIIWNKTYGRKKILLFLSLSSLIMIGYLLMRFHFSGNVYGDYGSRMTDVNFLNSVIKGAKTTSRLFLPPSENSNLLIVAFVALLIAMFVLNFRLYKMYGVNTLNLYIKLVMVLMVSLVIPVLFGISTRTSEGDRLLYFPSVFLSMTISIMILLLIRAGYVRVIACSIVSIYFITFLLLNNRNWEKASFISGKILNFAKEASYKNVIYINLPDEIEGAFVFRNGFNKALILNNIDTGRIWVSNLLTRLEYLELKDTIRLVKKTNVLILPPATRISFLDNDSVKVENTFNFDKRVFYKKNTTVLYWNKVDIIRVF
jgi:hypothetical protein